MKSRKVAKQLIESHDFYGKIFLAIRAVKQRGIALPQLAQELQLEPGGEDELANLLACRSPDEVADVMMSSVTLEPVADMLLQLGSR